MDIDGYSIFTLDIGGTGENTVYKSAAGKRSLEDACGARHAKTNPLPSNIENISCFSTLEVNPPCAFHGSWQLTERSGRRPDLSVTCLAMRHC